MRKFSESVDLGLLKKRYPETGFPMAIARVLMNLWSGPRAFKTWGGRAPVKRFIPRRPSAYVADLQEETDLDLLLALE